MSGMPQEQVTQLNFPLTTIKAVDAYLHKACREREAAIRAENLDKAFEASSRIALLLERRTVLTAALAKVPA